MISIYVGSNQERHKLIVDTGSMWTWIQNKACYNCGSWSDFTPESSTTWKYEKGHENDFMYTGYGSGEIYGKVGTDRVCLGVNETCAADHQIASVVAQRGLMNLNSEGIMGMALEGGADGTLIMDSLKKSGAIDHQVFAFLVSAEGHKKSKVTFGGTELDKYAKGPMHWHKIPDGPMWYVEMQGVSFEGVPLITGEVDDALVDTGTSYVSMPDEGRNKISNILESRYGMGQKTKGHTGNWQHECSAEAYSMVQPLEFYMDGTTYRLPREDWLPRREGKCML